MTDQKTIEIPLSEETEPKEIKVTILQRNRRAEWCTDYYHHELSRVEAEKLVMLLQKALSSDEAPLVPPPPQIPPTTQVSLSSTAGLYPTSDASYNRVLEICVNRMFNTKRAVLDYIETACRAERVLAAEKATEIVRIVGKSYSEGRVLLRAEAVRISEIIENILG